MTFTKDDLLRLRIISNLSKDYWEKKGIDLLEMAKFHREKAEKFEREADELLRKARKND